MKRLIRLYPRAWQDRYQDEFEAMLEQHHASISDRLNIAFGAIFAWFNPRFRQDQLGFLVPRRTATMQLAVVVSLFLAIGLGVSKMEPILIILLGILAAKLLLVGAALVLAMRVYRRNSHGSPGAAWRKGVLRIIGMALVFFFVNAAWLMLNGPLAHSIVLLYPVVPAAILALVLILLFSLMTWLVPRFPQAVQPK
jgi:hypothetical protein